MRMKGIGMAETVAIRKDAPTRSFWHAQEEEIVKLKERVKVLEDKEDVAVTQSRDDAPIKGRSINEGEAAVERISNNSEEIARVLTSMDAVTILAVGINVPTSSGFIPTAGPPATVISTTSEVGPTASPMDKIRKGKEVMVESDTPKKKKLQEQIDTQVARELEEQQEKENMRMNEQIARDVEVARIHAKEELQGMIDSLDKSNETTAKYLQEYQDFASELPLEKMIELISDLVKYQDNYYKVYNFQSQQRRPMTKKQKREYYMAVIRSNLGWRVKDFKGMSFEEIEAKFIEVWKQVEDFILMGSKEEIKRLNRKGLNLEQEQVKKKKSSEEALEIETSTEDVTEEKIKQMMQEDLNQLWALVKEYLSIRPARSEKEMELWVELKRMYEPDPEDQLWTLIQNFMHAPVEWKLYDLSRVHHLTAKDREIFMLVEKDYPLRKGLALVMITYKLQVENYSQMAEDLIRKIYNIANTPRELGIDTLSLCEDERVELFKLAHVMINTNMPLGVNMIHRNKLAEMPFIGTLIGFLKFGAKCSCVDAGVKGTSSSTINVEADIKTNQLVVLGGSGFLGLPICKVVAANHFMIICQVVQNPREEVADAEALLNITNTLVTSIKARSNEGTTTGLGIMNFEVNQQKVIVHRKHSRLTEKARTKQQASDLVYKVTGGVRLGMLQMPIMDKVKELGTVLMGKVESGSVHEDDNLLVMPNKVRVLAIYYDEARVRSAGPGKNLRVWVSGIKVEDILSGFVLLSIETPIPIVNKPLEQDIAICSDEDDPMKQGHKEEELRNVGWMLCQKVLTLRIMFLLLRPRLKSKYATGGRTNVLVHVTRVVKVDNAKVALLEGGSVESEKKLDLPRKNDVALSANHL
nr:eukaryotic peptide chain release factor GTP-binding subunit ERF3A [Tanacetum cinerariifolium]